VYLAAFPTSYVLSSVYPEGLFLLLTVGAFIAARRRSWPVAGLLTALALLTRPQGLFLSLPLLLEFAAAHHAAGHRWRDMRLLRGLWLVVPPIVALGGYALYSHAQTGYWLAFSIADTTVFARRVTPPIYPLVRYVLAPQIGSPTSFDFSLANFAGVLVLLTLIVVAWRRLPAPYTLWLVLCVLFPLSTGGHNLVSFVRYMAPTFPAFLALAAWSLDERWAPAGSAMEIRDAPRGRAASARELRDRLVLAPSLTFLAVWVIMFVNGYYGAA
jgi:4-amino-4-deoxy-L-arabinose transferase-like glycosyltransferase